MNNKNSSESARRARAHSRRTAALITVAAGALFASPASYAAGGGLDTTFGTGGIARVDFQTSLDDPNAVVVQPDSKVLVAGFSSIGGTETPSLARLNPNGTLDTTFGTGGKVLSPDGTLSAQLRAITLTPDGKIVAVGREGTGFNSGGDFVVLRYFADGSLDPSFGVGGRVKTDILGFEDRANAVTLQPDGKIVVAGRAITDSGSASALAVVRYNVNGTLDATFGTGGKVTTAFDAVGDHASGVAIQVDGKIVIGGTTDFERDSASGPNGDFVAVRFNANGSLDSTFGVGGKARTDLQPNNPINGLPTIADASALILQPDGKVVLTGNTYIRSFGDSSSGFAMVRYNVNGTLDPTFGTGGIVTSSTTNDSCLASVLQSDGKFLLAGMVDPNSTGNHDLGVRRFNSNGSVDTAFGTNGLASTDLGQVADTASAITVQADGRIVAAGISFSTASREDFGVLRYLVTGTVPPPSPPPKNGGGGGGGGGGKGH